MRAASGQPPSKRGLFDDERPVRRDHLRRHDHAPGPGRRRGRRAGPARLPTGHRRPNAWDGRLAIARGDVGIGGLVAPVVGFWDPATGGDLGGTPLDLPARIGTVDVLVLQRYSLPRRLGAEPAARRNLSTGQLTVGSTSALNEVKAIAFDPRRPELLAIGETDGQLRFYDVTTDRDVQPPVAALASPIVDLAFSADGSTLVGISQRGLIGVWWAGTDRTPSLRLGRTQRPAGQSLPARSVAFEDGSPVVIDNRDPAAPSGRSFRDR